MGLTIDLGCVFPRAEGTLEIKRGLCEPVLRVSASFPFAFLFVNAPSMGGRSGILMRNVFPASLCRIMDIEYPEKFCTATSVDLSRSATSS